MTSGARVLVLGLVLAAFALPAAVSANGDPSDQAADRAKTTEIQILGLNDFHGNLEPPAGSGGRIGGTEPQGNAGGVEFLATHVRALRPRTRTRSSCPQET